MSLQVTPYKNHFTGANKPFFARTRSSGHVDFDKLVGIMAGGRTTLSAPDIAASFILFKEELAKLLSDGKTVHTPLGSFYLCASGKFENEDQAFTLGEGDGGHDVTLHFRAARDYQNELKAKAEIERAERTDKYAPVVRAVACVECDDASKARPGDFIRVEGLRIKFNRADQEEGVFFVNGSDHRAAKYAFVSPRVIVAEVPASLEPGAYSVAVRTKTNGKDAKEGRLNEIFTISS